MEITYDMIIKYLAVGNQNKFTTKKNFTNDSMNFPKKFIDYLDPTYFRYGIQIYNNNQDNISFFTSIIHVLNKNFVLKDKNEQISYIKKLKTARHKADSVKALRWYVQFNASFLVNPT